MDEILEFLKSIDDGKIHELKNKDVFGALKGKNDEVTKILGLKKQGLVEINTGMVHGSPTITGYYLTDKGKKYIKDHTSKFSNKFKKIF